VLVVVAVIICVISSLFIRYMIMINNIFVLYNKITVRIYFIIKYLQLLFIIN